MGERDLVLNPDLVKGFLAPEEGERLYDLALQAAPLGPCLEVGSYCGKSTIYLGSACKARDTLLYAVDHHRGSEEHQLGEEYHDSDLYDAEAGRMDSFRSFRRTLQLGGLEETVVPLVASSSLAGRHWATPLSLVFIDGGHSLEAAQTDLNTWAPHVVIGGYLAIHDVFFDPEEGGQAPREIYEDAWGTGCFEMLEMTGTLGVLKRTRR